MIKGGGRFNKKTVLYLGSFHCTSRVHVGLKGYAPVSKSHLSQYKAALMYQDKILESKTEKLQAKHK